MLAESLLWPVPVDQIVIFVYVCDLTDLAGVLSGEVNRPKPGANVLLGV